MMVWLLWLYLLLLFNSLIYSLTSSSSFLSSPSPLCHHDESSALLLFKNSFTVDHEYCLLCPPYGFSNNPCQTLSWENGTDCCTWSGVTCDKKTGHVIGLDLNCGGLVGIIQSNSSLFLLRHLQSLILSYNEFKGSQISSQFGRFASMTHLDLYYSQFSGKVPPEISHLSKLVTLNLSSNLDLTLETSWVKRSIQNVTNIKELALGDINMSSILPISLVNLSSSLTSLDISETRMHGEFPECIFRLPNLQVLSLSDNENLHGSFPKYNWSSPIREMSLSRTGFLVDLQLLTTSLKCLDTLFLSHCHFKGSYPTLLKNLSKITSLVLSSNNFSGQIPWSSLNLEKLTLLDLSDNHLTGQIPEICNNLTQTYSSCNSSKDQLVGPLPLNLKSLWLSDNLLNGTMPSWLYSLPSLQNLDLRRNQLTGQIKEFQFHSLLSFSIDHNKICGHIPRSIFEQVNLSSLDLSFNNLSGYVWFDQFSELKNLYFLDLSFNSLLLKENNFNYTLPKYLNSLALSSCNITAVPLALRNLEHLYSLNLSHNQIEGRIPQWLWNMSKDSLQVLDLSHNFLTTIEQIPWAILRTLDLSFNLLRGGLPIPPPFIYSFIISNNQLTRDIPSLVCNLSSLVILDLSNNRFSGKLPPCIGKLHNLSVLDLQQNRFHGMIPATFVKGNNLRNLDLNGNQLEGSLPRSLLACKNLEVLDLGNNKINDTFPHWLESLSMLQVLVLKSNKFHGSIAAYPKVRFPFRKLRIMDLSHNEFNGPLPTKYFEKLMAMVRANTSLEYMGDTYYHDSVRVVMKGIDIELVRILNIFTSIDFSQNNFEGEIPKSIGKLKSLKGLNFSHNKLTSLIPPSLGDLSELEWLDLSSNMLSGEIPQQLANLMQLEKLNLSLNKLVGPIPHGNQFNTFSNDSYSGNFGLCGFPLSKSCSKQNLTQEEGEDHEEELKDGLFDWKIVMMGYGCGVVIGVSVGYMVLFTKRFDYWIRKRIRGRQGQHCKTNARLRGRRRN